MRKNSGFTLLEMLIVVAIIGILVAVAIPAFNSQLDKTRETACNANRRSLYMVVTVNYMTDEYPSLSSAFTSIYSLNGAEYKCPSEGTYSWVDDAEGARWLRTRLWRRPWRPRGPWRGGAFARLLPWYNNNSAAKLLASAVGL